MTTGTTATIPVTIPWETLLGFLTSAGWTSTRASGYVTFTHPADASLYNHFSTPLPQFPSREPGIAFYGDVWHCYLERVLGSRLEDLPLLLACPPAPEPGSSLDAAFSCMAMGLGAARLAGRLLP